MPIRLPLIRSLLAFNAYSEGWALYAEQLGDELGVYDDDPLGELGYLQSMEFRACRLVVDTRPPRQALEPRAGDRLVRHAPMAIPRSSITSEVDRYCVMPGQACGYKVGHIEINRLRDKAKAALGRKLRPAHLRRRGGEGRQRAADRARNGDRRATSRRLEGV